MLIYRDEVSLGVTCRPLLTWKRVSSDIPYCSNGSCEDKMSKTSKQTPKCPKTTSYIYPPTILTGLTTRIQLWEPHLASEPVDFSPIENQIFPHELIAARDKNNKPVTRQCPCDWDVHHAYLNMLSYQKEKNTFYLALIMASTHSTHCSSESHSKRYFLSASSRNASSRNKDLLIITQCNYQNSNWQTTLQWTDD